MTDKLIEKEAFYDVLQNVDGDVLFCVQARGASPENPQMLYNDADKILFYRRPDETVLLDAIHPDIRENLAKIPQVLVAEYLAPDNENPNRGIIREYMVTLRHVTKFPETIGL